MQKIIHYFLLFLFCAAVGTIGVSAVSAGYDGAARNQAALTALTGDLTSYHDGIAHLSTLKTTAVTAMDQGVDTSSVAGILLTVKHYLDNGRYAEAERLIDLATADLESQTSAKQVEARQAQLLKEQQDALAKQQEAEAEQKRGDLKGVVKGPSGVLANALVTLLLADSSIATSTTGSDGSYSFHQTEGIYTVTAERSGYVKQRKEKVAITAQQSAALDFTLDKVPPPTPVPPKPKSTASPSSTDDSTAYSSYRLITVATERGSFSVRLLTLDLGSGHIRVITDTANSSDCPTDCAVKSVQQYVSENGGFAGVNGTYFCPTSYGASCAGQTNSYFWKIFNSRYQIMINRNNGLGENDPFFTFDSHGTPKFFNSWNDSLSSSFPIYAGINSKPYLIRNGQNILTDAAMDDKERTAHIVRTAIGLKGTTMYVAVTSAATVGDSAAVMQALGMDYAVNIDGGGSSGLYYKGKYKSGPGRNVPNAIVFVEI